MLDGRSEHMPVSELAGGARIRHIFQEIFNAGLEQLDPTRWVCACMRVLMCCMFVCLHVVPAASCQAQAALLLHLLFHLLPALFICSRPIFLTCPHPLRPVPHAYCLPFGPVCAQRADG